jgi:hypothetical protein
MAADLGIEPSLFVISLIMAAIMYVLAQNPRFPSSQG